MRRWLPAAVAILASAPQIAQLPIGPEVQANTYTTFGQWAPAVTVAPDGTFVVTWSSETSSGDDTSNESIQLRRFHAAVFADGFEGGDVSRWTSGSN